MTNEFIEKFIHQNAKAVGGIKVFTLENTEVLVNLLVDNGKKILGIDGIFVSNEGDRPSMEDSILVYKWYDEGLSNEQIKERILQFITSRKNNKDLFFEIVF